MKSLPQILSHRVVARSRIFTVEALDLRFGNGVEVQYERLHSGLSGAVLIVPVTDDDQLVLIHEYAAGVGRYELGFPKGKVDAGEDWREASIRECMEEAGYRPGHVALLDTVSLSAGYMNHVTHLVVAESLVPATLPGDEPEALEVVHWPLSDWKALLDEPAFSEGRAYAALLRLLLYKERL